VAYEKKSLTAMREEYDAKAKNLHDIFVAHPEIEKMPADVALKIRPMNDELAEITAAIEEAEILVGAKSRSEKRFGGDGRGEVPDAVKDQKGGAQKPVIKSIEQIVAESTEYKSFLEGKSKSATFELSGAEMKTLMTLTTISPEATRLPGIYPSIQDNSDISGLFLPGTMSGNVLQYYEETTVTNAAAETSEGEAKPEAALGYTLRTKTASKVPVWIPATDEMLSDMPQMLSVIQERLAWMVRQRVAQQVITGNGTDPNISGVLDHSIQSQAKGTDPAPDAFYRAMQKVRTLGDAEPDAVVINPNDWTDIRLMRTAEDIYLWGNPSQPGDDTLWGKPVYQLAKITENTGLTGAFRPHGQLFYRQGMTIKISTEHDDYFVKNKVAILAEVRLALAIYRPYAFCQVTGI